MKPKKLILFAVLVTLFAGAVYFFDVVREEKIEQKKNFDSGIIKFEANQINYIEITKANEKIILQKNEKGWLLIEPIQDQGDQELIEKFISQFVLEKYSSIAKDTQQLKESDLNEFGLDQPIVSYVFKNNLGQSIKVDVGSQKNFEGYSFIRVNSEPRVLVASTSWFTKAEEKLIYYREKRLYRTPLVDIISIKIKSLQEQIELKKVDGVWKDSLHDFALDQNLVRETIRKISDSSVQEYVFEGEPSKSLILEKGLMKSPLQVEFHTVISNWTVRINQNEKENAIFALTDRPTRLLKLDKSIWELIGNLNLDSLRDRVSVTQFKLDEVKSFYFKYKSLEYKLKKEKDRWMLDQPIADGETFNSAEVDRVVNRIHDLEISEFIDKKRVDQFKGDQMIILKSASGNLVYQLNWGPSFKMKKKFDSEKDYEYARTQVASSIFAIEKNKIDDLGLEKVVVKK